MEKIDLAQMAQRMVDIALKAGEAIMSHYAARTKVADKEDNSPLTLADLAAHEVIAAALERITPSIPVISEESSQKAAYALRKDWPFFWLVDPLDGTKEFLKGNDEFTVNIALIQGRRPALGVVTAPALKKAYMAWKGGGAYRSINNGPWGRITCSSHETGPLKVAASRSHRTAELEAFLAKLGDCRQKDAGSSLKFMLVAEGEAHLYPRIGPTMEWDTAAGQMVVEEAGGAVTRLDGGPMEYNKESLLNPYFLAMGKPPYPWKNLLGGINRS